jgi:hypothetical protein
MFNRNLAILAAACVGMAAAPAVAASVADVVPLPGSLRGKERHPSRGKRKLPRHGQKLKSCRNKVSRRVRRKHRRAA